MAMTILQAALTFFADKMRILLTILTTDITTYEGGVIWNAISNVYDAILAMGVTIAGVLIWFGLLSSTSRYAELKKASVWVQFLIEIVLTNAVLYYGKFLLLECIKIGQGMTEKLMHVTGMLTTNGNSIFIPAAGIAGFCNNWPVPKYNHRCPPRYTFRANLSVPHRPDRPSPLAALYEVSALNRERFPDRSHPSSR